MKQKVKFSAYNLIITAVVLVLFAVGIFSLVVKAEKLTIFCIIMGLATIAGLYYCPISIEANQSGVKLNRLLSGAKDFRYDEI